MTDWLADFSRRRPGAAILTAWAALVVLIAPYGEFSINDDWAYTFSIRWFFETGELRLTFWNAMTLVGQLVLGGAWASLFGTSELAFRLFTATLAGAGLVAFYRLIIAGGGARPAAAAATACLLAFPIFQASALSFMTDAPHLALSTFAALAFAHAVLRVEGGWRYFAVGLGFLTLALLIRQTAAAVAIGVVGAELIAHGLTRRTALRSAIVLATTAGVLAAYSGVMRHAGLLPEVYDLRYAEMATLIRDAARLDVDALAPMTIALMQSARLFGVFVAPLVVVLLVDRVFRGGARRYWIVAALAAAPVLVAAAASDFRLASAAASVLGPDGVGPRAIEPQSINLAATPFLVALTVVGSAAFGILVAEFDRHRAELSRRLAEDRRRAAVVVMVAVIAAASLAPYGLTTLVFFDRYVLLPGAFLLAALAMAAPPVAAVVARRRRAAVAAFGGAALFGAVLVHDSFVWNRARHQLIADVVATGVDPAQIDGGFEHNMRLLLSQHPGESMRLSLAASAAEKRPYATTKRLYTNHIVIAERAAGQILPIGGDRLYVLRRPPQQSRAIASRTPSVAEGAAP